ncbi:MAG: hypothetical protein Phog2KO_49460 [Phototrophicaceae bacterium]
MRKAQTKRYHLLTQLEKEVRALKAEKAADKRDDQTTLESKILLTELLASRAIFFLLANFPQELADFGKAKGVTVTSNISKEV